MGIRQVTVGDIVKDRLHIRHLPVLAGKQLLGTVSIRDLQDVEADVREAELRFLDEYFDRMDEAAWGLIPVEQLGERVVIQCKGPQTRPTERERAAA